MAAGVNALCRDCLWRGSGQERHCPACRSRRILVHDELFDLQIAHIDCDAFYASVEKRDRPELRDRPIIVGGGARGVVTTACYIARTFGVRSAMPMFKARALCPQAVILAPNFSKYRNESRRILQRAFALTPLVQPLSLDEAWMDLSGTARLHAAAPATLLARLQKAIEEEIGLAISVGLAPNKFLAKVASDIDKPRGFAVIGAAEASAVLSPLPITVLPGVGPALSRRLAARGLHAVGDIARIPRDQMKGSFGDQGLRLLELSSGRDNRTVEPNQARKSISAERTFETDLITAADLEHRLWPLCEKVAFQARAERVAGTAVTLKLRRSDFQILTRRRTLDRPTQTARTLFRVAQDMLGAEAMGEPWRLIGVGLSAFGGAQSSSDLFANEEQRHLDGEQAIDALRAKYGAGAVVNARTLKA